MTRRPSHPGAIIRGLYMEPLGLTVTALADHLGISRKTLSKILNENARVTPDIAQRLARAFNTDAGLWLGLQRGRDQWDAEYIPGGRQNVEPLPGLHAAALPSSSAQESA
ncbi:MAG: HigA family addiction module antidote protein [Desulfovibrio sp.]|nr:HigA family addiction module antidote protein [Desulfovibrio sp.]